jgi:hypothetical protein
MLTFKTPDHVHDPKTTIIKPGPARWVDPGPELIRTRQKTSTRKKPAKPGQTWVRTVCVCVCVCIYIYIYIY